MNIVKCVAVDILRRNGADCTNGGISSRFNEVLVEVPNGYLEVDVDNPPENLCRIVRRNFLGNEYVHLEPVSLKGRCAMAGGNYAYASDSRFNYTISNGGYPVSIHDRVED